MTDNRRARPERLRIFTTTSFTGASRATYVQSSALIPRCADSNTLYLRPDSANTTRALTANGANLRNLMVQRTAALAGMMDYDCPSFDQYRVCLGFQARYSGMETLHDGAGVLTAAARLSPHLRLGGFIDQGATRNMPTGLRQNAQPPSFGAFLGFNQRTDSLGLQGRISAAMNRGDLRVTRDVSLENVEAGDGKARLAGSAVAAELGYADTPLKADMASLLAVKRPTGSARALVRTIWQAESFSPAIISALTVAAASAGSA